jgi:hypothetical protein
LQALFVPRFPLGYGDRRRVVTASVPEGRLGSPYWERSHPTAALHMVRWRHALVNDLDRFIFKQESSNRATPVPDGFRKCRHTAIRDGLRLSPGRP